MSDLEAPGQFQSRTAASATVTSLGWRYVRGVTQTSVQAASLVQAAQTAERASWCGAVNTLPGDRSVQVLEIAIDALDIASIRPFWRAILGYGDEPGHAGTLCAGVRLQFSGLLGAGRR